MHDDEITQKTKSLDVLSRHAAIGALAEEFFKGLSEDQREMLEGFLPKDLLDLLKKET